MAGRNLLRFAAVLTFLVLGNHVAHATNLKAIKLNDRFLQKHEAIGRYMLTASDKKGQMSPKAIMQGRFNDKFEDSGGRISVGYGANRPWPHWAVFAVDNPGGKYKKLVLEAGYSAIDKLTLYHVTADGEILNQTTLGDRMPFSERPIQYRHPVYPLELNAGRNYFIAKIDTSSMVVFEFILYSDTGFKNAKLQELIVVGILLGGIAIILVYNFFLYLSTGDKNYGIYVIYVASYMTFALAYFGILPYFAFTTWKIPPLTGWDLYVVIDVITIGSGLFAINFLDLKQSSKWFYRILIGFVTLAALNILVAIVSQGAITICKPITLFNSFFCGLILIAAGFYRTIKGYNPAVYFTTAWSCVITGNVLVLLANSGVIEKNFITTWSQLIGANLEMVLLSFALGARINLIKSQKLRAEREMLRQTEEKRKLQAELIETQEENIRTLDAKVKERTRDIREILTNINQGIFTLQKDMAIGEEFSDHLTTMLDDRNLAQRPLREAFLDRTNLSQDEVSRIITSLEFSIGEDADFGWNANKDSLTREFRLGTDDKSLIVEADWSPIVNQDGEVEKVLVALRDVTELRALRARAAAKEQEATMLLEMLSNDLEKTQKFLERSLQNWYKIDEVLVTYLNDTETNYNALYRLYHTLKGNARSLNFAGIASAIHDLETQLKDVYENYTPEKLEVLRKQSNETHSLIRNYHTIFLAKFARFMNDGSQKKAELFETFFENNVLSTVERVAKDLGRPIPVVEIDNPHGLQVTSDEIEEILQNILNHLVRNSLDHGIEPAEERRNAGKTPYGHIQISIAIDESKKATIKFYDDGRGLNMSRIYQLGVEKGLLSEGANEEELVEVVFRPGFSTAKSTSMISGRGVGMDAVRHYALSLQASFNLVLDQPLTEELMEKIRSAGDDDVYITFRFESEVSLSTRQTPSSVDQAS